MKKLVFGAAFSIILGVGAVHAQDASPSPSAAASPATTMPECKPTPPEKEHTWLKQLEGEWDIETEAIMAPGQPPIKGKATESTRMFGPYHVDGNMKMEMGPGQSMTSRITVGFDKNKKKYVGTFISDMDGFMWVYEGAADAAGKKLTLDTTGPSFTDPTKMSKYQESIEVVDADHRVFTSSIEGADGKWTTFMTNKYTRKK